MAGEPRPSLPTRYDFAAEERRLVESWLQEGVFQFNVQRGRPLFAIDTPPPTVSGDVHLGHVFSYTQQDAIARFWRMQGCEVFYPFGFDDNGLPTERLTEKRLGIRAHEMRRREFVARCLETTREVEAEFERFWKRLGLSVDWRYRYSTIDPHARRVSQHAFLDLVEKGLAYRRSAPSLWCPECQTAIAQAEIEDRELPSRFTTLSFALEPYGAGPAALPIATTRPELLPACVAIFVHPEDGRFRHLVGRKARVPLFDRPVPVLADPGVDPEKGTGAVMCCTFGDLSDIRWWKEHGLPLRVVVTREGRLNEAAGPYAGLPLAEARESILTDLAAAGQIRGQERIVHAVGVHERCGASVEYVEAVQWFINVLDHKEALLAAGRSIEWRPPFMAERFARWVEGLNWDWSISRQRFFGVPFPVWYCRACRAVLTARRGDLPVDPLEQTPPDPCPSCGSQEAEPDPDVMDTWATSSLTPAIACGWLADDERFRRLYPMALRPQSHEIIRTWAFYSIVRGLFHFGEAPWRQMMISGWAVNPAGEKLSKSKGNATVGPDETIARFSADGVRYWACRAPLGRDTAVSEGVMQNGQRLVIKLWNAARFAAPHLPTAPPAPPADAEPVDRWLLARLAATIEQATAAYRRYEYHVALAETERFFWSDLADNYIELVKRRLYAGDVPARQSAQYALFHALRAVLKLLAPVMPFVTETIYQADYAAGEGVRSLHLSAWPQAEIDWADPAAQRFGETLGELVSRVRRYKSEHHLPAGAPLGRLTIAAPEESVAWLRRSEADLVSVTRAAAIEIRAAAELAVEAVTVG